MAGLTSRAYRLLLQLGSHRWLLIAELEIIEPPVEALGSKQHLVSTPLNYPAGLQYHDLVCIPHGCKSVGND